MSAGIAVRRVPVESARQFAEAVFRALGVGEPNVPILAGGLMNAELRALPGQGQGLRRLRGYATRIRNGEIRLGVQPVVVVETEAMVLLDGQNGLGQVNAVRAMDLAIAKAARQGIGMAFVRHSNHLGMASYPAMRALAHEQIGLCMTNAGPEMAPYGARTAVLGTNPWGIAVPTGGPFPLTLDIALTTSGKGMIRWHLREGKPIPPDWALTPEGEASTDPAAVLLGALLPIGGFKGSGLSFMTDVLCGVLTGAAFGLAPYRDPMNHDVGHAMLALDIKRFMPIAEFYARLGQLIEQVKQAEPRPGFGEVLVPGEVEHRRTQARLRDGLELDPEILDDLNRLAEELGIPERLTPR